MREVKIDNLGIPPLAGICSYREASVPGYGVEQNVALLRRYNYVETRLNQIGAAHLASTPEWEVKCALSLHLYLDAEHSTAIRARVGEMREPPLHLDKVPDPRLQTLMEEVIRPKSTLELLVGIYRVVRPELARSLRKHIAETNPLVDYPTVRVLKLNLQEEEEMIAWGEQAIAALSGSAAARDEAAAWEQALRAFVAAAGGIAGDQPVPDDLALPERRSDGAPFEMDATPRRDARFADGFNVAAKIDEYYRDESLPYDERVYALIYKRIREMDVPEWMGPIVYKTRGKPFEYYVDISRQLWDEARHAMMGEVALVKEGVAFYRYPIDYKMSTLLNTEFAPLDAHLILWAIEQGLMRRETGKKFELNIAQRRGDELLVTFQDYDWADEVLHTQIGRKWLPADFKSSEDMRNTAAALTERIYERMPLILARSTQENWWPNFLAEARGSRQLAPA